MNIRDPGKPDAEDDPINELPLGQLAQEKAPASLTRRLYRIPLEHGGKPPREAFALPRWAFSVGFATAAVMAVALIIGGRDGGAPDAAPQVAGSDSQDINTRPDLHPEAEPADVAAARRDLAIAFSYLDKAGLSTSREIREVLREELASPIKDNLSRHIPYMPQVPKEKHA